MLSILIIDDNPDDRALAIRQLKREFADIEVWEISNENEFERVLLNRNFNFVITDYQLCWSNGLAILAAINQNYPQCPVIMFTDSGNEEVAAEGLKAGLNDYVLKRKNFRHLAITVRQCLEKQQIHNEYAIAQERFRLAQSAGNFGIWDWDLLTNRITWDENHSRLFGISLGTFDGSYEMFIDCIHPEDRDKVTQAVNYALENQTDYCQEFRIIRADGSIRWMDDRGRFFYDASGQAIRATGIVLDISDRKEREVALETYLQGLVQAYRLKDEFLDIASHELRTPLNAVLGWAQLLRKYNFDEATRNERLETIERNLRRQQQLVEQILDTSRLKSGQMQLESAVVDLKAVINTAIEAGRLALDAKSMHLQSIFDDRPILVLGDKQRLHQIVWNLISNAIKFTPDGGQITVRLEAVDDRVQITVSDTGQGIGANFLPYVFDQFRQEDSSRRRKHQGAGLGLTIVRQLVELHGGSIKAESQGAGQGATFTVRFPLLKEDKAATVKEKLIDSSDRSVFNLPLEGLHVLVVDDEADTLNFLVTLLENEGAIVTAANSATQALRFLNKCKPDILISDLMMPEIDGYMLLEYVKFLESSWGQPLRKIAITAHHRQEPNSKALKAGFQVSLYKPIEPDELISVIGMLKVK